MKFYLLITIFFIFWLNSSISQDGIDYDSKFSIESKGQHNLSAVTTDLSCISCSSTEVTDNPFFHLAVYTGINYELTLNKKYKILTGLYLEERSHSGGNNTLSNLVVFPRIQFQVEDTFNIGKHKIGVAINGGDLWNEDINDILRIYNIDYQGIMASFNMRSVELGFMTIGDLSKNVGLDLHQLYRFHIKFKNRNLVNNISLSINQLVPTPIGTHLVSQDINLSYYSEMRIIEELQVKGQFDLRINQKLPISTAAAVVVSYKKNDLNLKSSVRYYSSSYNTGYDGKQPLYYGTNGSYVGEQLYSLKNYYRQFSQWAVYTHSGNGDLLAFELGFGYEKLFYKKIGYFLDTEVNYITDLQKSESKWYPSYNVGFQISFLEGFKGRFSVTNKHMDLRNYYQTYNYSKYPFLSLGFILKIRDLRLRTFC